MQENIYFVFPKTLNDLLDNNRDLHSFGDAPKQGGSWLTTEFYWYKYHDFKGWLALRASKTWIQMLVSSICILLYRERENRNRKTLNIEGIVLVTFYRC